MIQEDPIVMEVRKWREEIFAECGYSMRVLGERLKELESRHKDRLISPMTGNRNACVAEELANYGKFSDGE